MCKTQERSSGLLSGLAKEAFVGRPEQSEGLAIAVGPQTTAACYPPLIIRQRYAALQEEPSTRLLQVSLQTLSCFVPLLLPSSPAAGRTRSEVPAAIQPPHPRHTRRMCSMQKPPRSFLPGDQRPCVAGTGSCRRASQWPSPAPKRRSDC